MKNTISLSTLNFQKQVESKTNQQKKNTHTAAKILIQQHTKLNQHVLPIFPNKTKIKKSATQSLESRRNFP